MTARYDVAAMHAERTLRRFTVDEYERMAELGILGPEDRVELVEGVIVEMAAIGWLHAGTVIRANRLLVRAVGDRGVVSPQNPLRLPPWSEPEPDVCVFRPRSDDYTRGHAEAGDTLLCIEVADTTLRADTRKMFLYARNGLREVWLVDLPGDRIVVHREPSGDGYSVVEVFERGSRITPLAFPDLALPVDDILPPMGA